jgi:hypothetical protein
MNVTASESAYFNITIPTKNNFAADVALSVENLPQDTIVNLTPTSIGPSNYSILEVRTLLSTPVGTHQITIKGDGSGISRTVKVTLEILPARAKVSISNVDGISSDSNIKDGQKVKLEAWIVNTGLVNADKVKVELLVDDVLVDTENTNISIDSASVVDLSWKAKAGNHILTVKATYEDDYGVQNHSLRLQVYVVDRTDVFPTWILLVIIALIVLILVIVLIGYRLGKKETEHEEEDIEEEPLMKKKGAKRTKISKDKKGPPKKKKQR